MKHSIDYGELLIWVMGGVTVFFMPIAQYFIAMSILVTGDILTRILVVRKTEGWKAVRSKRLYDSIPKLIAYSMAIICFHTMEYFIDATIPLAKLICYFIASVELKSIAENIDELTGINLFDFVKGVFARRNNYGKPDVNEEKETK